MEKKKILIIDDEKDLCLMMKLNLERIGEYEVTTVYSGEEGLKIAKEIKFDISEAVSEEEEEIVEIEEYNCPDCGAVVTSKDTACPKCGLEFEEEEMVEEPEEEVKEEEAEEVMEEKEVEEKAEEEPVEEEEAKEIREEKEVEEPEEVVEEKEEKAPEEDEAT